MKKFCALIALAVIATFGTSAEAKAQPISTPTVISSSPASVVYYDVNGTLVPVQQGVVVYQPVTTTWYYSNPCCHTVRYYYTNSCCNTVYYSYPVYYRTSRHCGWRW